MSLNPVVCSKCAKSLTIDTAISVDYVHAENAMLWEALGNFMRTGKKIKEVMETSPEGWEKRLVELFGSLGASLRIAEEIPGAEKQYQEAK